MRKLNTSEIKERLLEMLEELDRFCISNGINYSLGEGTLIGSVRHKGFIPWDDDVDVLMCRDDYERFISIYHSDRFRVICNKKNKDWHMLIARLVDDNTIAEFYNPYDIANYHHGLWIDICPIDNSPNELRPLCKMVNKARFYFSLESYRNYYPVNSKIKTIFKKIISLFLRLFPSNYFVGKAEETLKSYRKEKTKKRGFFPCIWHDPYIFSSSVFNDYLDAEFEGRTFKIAKGYDEYLRAQYGDYMQLPPEKERVPDKHSYSIYIKD